MKPLLLLALLPACCLTPVFAQTPNSVTAPLAASAVDVQALINRAIADGAKRVVIPPGTYRLTPTADYQPHLKIQNAKDLEIVAQGVTIVCTKPERAVHMANCRNVTLSGLTVDYDPLPFSQGTITEQSNDGRGFTVRIDKGYPTPTGNIRTHVIDGAQRRIKAGTWSRYSGKLAATENGLVNITWSNPVKDTTQAGDRVVLVGDSRTPHGIMQDGNSNVTLREVTLHASTSFGFYESQCEANRYERCRITPGPTPAGATEPRLLSTNADGIHSKYASKGPTIESCVLENMADDGIAINGDYAAVLEQKDRSLWIVPRREPTFRAGDAIRVLDQSGQYAGEAKIVNLSRETARDTEVAAFRAAHLDGLRNNPTFKTVWKIETDAPLAAKPGDILSSPDRNGNGFTVRNNTIRNNRARGILVKASNGVIEGNTIDGSSMRGIVLGPEPGLWMEADFSRNVIIRNNTIRNVGQAADNVGSLQAGIISVVAPTPRENGIAAAGGHRNITIENNRIENSRGVGLAVTSSQDVTIRGNVFQKLHAQPDLTGSRRGVDTKAAIWLYQSTDIKLENNIVAGLGIYGDKLLSMGAGVSRVTGDSSGIKLTVPKAVPTLGF